jgi:hypothetical protein
MADDRAQAHDPVISGSGDITDSAEYPWGRGGSARRMQEKSEVQ